LVVFRDVLDGTWLGMAHRQSADGDEYLCAPVSVQRLADFQRGKVDLRTVFTELEAGTLARVFVRATESAREDANIEVASDVSPDWLPDSGFLFTAFHAPSDADDAVILTDLFERKRALVHLNLNPPEAQEAHTIDATTLADGLALFQNAVKHGYLLWRRTTNAIVRKGKASPDDFTLQAYALAPGSFEVHLQAKNTGDLFGYAPQVEALRKLDEIMLLVDKPEEAVQVAIKYRGHFVSSVRQLLKFVATKQVPLRYKWTEPTTAVVTRNVIRPEPAQELYTELSRREELSQQDVKYVGRFTDLLHQGRWSLETAEGEVVTGTLVEDAGFSLHGVSYFDKVYEIECREVLDQVIVSGVQSSTLVLLAPPKEVTGPSQ
jgi:hypothetical protein